nr:serine/threonine-protein kinase SBK1-like [Cherax quadricarinatus]
MASSSNSLRRSVQDMTISSCSSLYTIKMLELPRMEVERQFSDVRLLVESTNGVKVYSARRLQSGNSVVLKCVQKKNSNMKDFIREFHYNYCLSDHPSIVKCFDEAFETADAYVFTEEYAPVSDLSKFVKVGGIGETRAKRVVEQISLALEFMRQQGLVHRDVCLENIFVFNREVTRFKLGDFGSTQRAGARAPKMNVRSPWAPPETYNEGYHVHSGQDAWQLGILIFMCLTGSYPWSLADISDPNYNSWTAWHRRRTTKVPSTFKCFTPHLLRLLRRLLHPKPEKRKVVCKVSKYLSRPWLVKEAQNFAISSGSQPEFLLNLPLFTRLWWKLADMFHSHVHHPTAHLKGNKTQVASSQSTSLTMLQ